MALPGRKQPDIKKKPTKKGQADAGAEEDGLILELGFEEMKNMGNELKGLRESHAQEQLEKIQKLRSEQPQPKKKKGDADTRLDVSELVTETEARKGGMPEHIAALPANHPIRVRWEKGFRQREDGTWFQLSADEMQNDIGISEEKQRAFLIIPLIVIGIALIIGGNWYASKLTDTRADIINTVKLKGIKDKPETKEKLIKAYKSQWLPELTGILDDFKKAKRSFEEFSDNQESGSYIQHIKKHDKEFDAEEAMQWRTRSIRKPSQ
ncbi:MAG: hypothetical protein HQL68_12125 [Magnetococcales bacterium]|nr:hypothetical protein [Magnetococcales bacterium]